MAEAKLVLYEIGQTASTKAEYERLVRTVGSLASFPYHPCISKDKPQIYSQS